MAPGPIEVRPTIDRAWLERAAAQDPVAHAFALWDLERNPGRIRIFSAMDGDRTLGYLLVWLGHPRATVVHWVGTTPETRALAAALPSRPLVAIVPEEAESVVTEARGPARRYTVLVMERPATPPPVPPAVPGTVRTLERSDVPLLSEWARRQSDPVVAEYPFLDPDEELTWGAFDGPKLVGVVHAEVRRPGLWVLGGVYVEPEARRRGRGRELIAVALAASARARVRVALFVREDRAEARALYEGVGFHPAGRRVWLDLGAGLSP